MGEHDDKVFMKQFGGIIAGLVIVTILIIIIAVGNDNQEEGTNPSKAKLAAERVEPVGSVRTELPDPKSVAGPVEVGPVTVDLADNAEVLPASDAAEAGAGAIDGAALYASACAACHMAGVAGAPVPGADSMAERAAKGVEAVVAAAIAGVGPIMQPKGGRADLSDEEIRAIVEHMLAQ
jgi:cytochrome c5